jgi:hypothetical protein
MCAAGNLIYIFGTRRKKVARLYNLTTQELIELPSMPDRTHCDALRIGTLIYLIGCRTGQLF